MATSKKKPPKTKTKAAKAEGARVGAVAAPRTRFAPLDAEAPEASEAPQGLFLSFFNAVTTLEDAANVFRDQARNQALPSDMREEAALNHLELKREITRLEAEHSALEARFSGIGGPSPAQLSKAQSLSQALAKDIHRAELTVALLTIATKFVDGWMRIDA
jgi:hypothetical protein